MNLSLPKPTLCVPLVPSSATEKEDCVALCRAEHQGVDTRVLFMVSGIVAHGAKSNAAFGRGVAGMPRIQASGKWYPKSAITVLLGSPTRISVWLYGLSAEGITL